MESPFVVTISRNKAPTVQLGTDTESTASHARLGSMGGKCQVAHTNCVQLQVGESQAVENYM